MKKKILYFCLDKRDTTSFWRMAILRYVHQKDFDLVDISGTTQFDWTTFFGASTLIFQRAFAKEHINIIQAAKNIGLKIILDYDDDLTCVDMFNPTYQMYRDNQGNLKSCLSLADEIWVSTKSIKDSFSFANNNIHIIPNAHNDYLFPVSKKKSFDGTQKKCYYRGGGSHQADVNSAANDLIKVINAHKDWTFSFMGDRYTYLEMNTGDNYHIIGYTAIMEYFRHINHENPQIMIFPLCNTKFNAGKSNISFIEATYAGAAFFGNKNLPEFDIDYILPMEHLLQVSDLKYYNDKSWEYICQNLLLSKVNKTREERLLENM